MKEEIIDQITFATTVNKTAPLAKKYFFDHTTAEICGTSAICFA